jgi:hypothetical protein
MTLWALLSIAGSLLLLGIARAIYVAGYRRGVDRERGRAMRVGAAMRAAGRRGAC